MKVWKFVITALFVISVFLARQQAIDEVYAQVGSCLGAYECGQLVSKCFDNGSTCSCGDIYCGERETKCINTGNPGTGVHLCLENRSFCGADCFTCVVAEGCFLEGTPPPPTPIPIPTSPPPPPPPGCTCGGWVDGACGGGTCEPSFRLRTRTCSPAGCDIESRCTPDAACAPPVSCDIEIPFVSLNGVGDSATVPVEIPPLTGEVGGKIVRVDFFSFDTGVATVTTPDISKVFQTTVTATGLGDTSYLATATMDDGLTTCIDFEPVSVGNPVGWWQVKEGDVVTNGSIFSEIPPGCSLPSCDPVFITSDSTAIPPSFPGVASHDGSYGSGTVSSTNWLAANSAYSSTEPYSYAFFEARIPRSVTPVDPGLTLNVADVTTGALGPAGYYWFQTSTDLQITNPGGASSVGSNKVIVFVDGNLTINGRIPVNDGTGSFLVVVSEDISIDPSVGGPQEVPTPLPDLEGLYITDGSFNTGTISVPIFTFPF